MFLVSHHFGIIRYLGFLQDITSRQDKPRSLGFPFWDEIQYCYPVGVSVIMSGKSHLIKV
jgi:hypothetical protein